MHVLRRSLSLWCPSVQLLSFPSPNILCSWRGSISEVTLSWRQGTETLKEGYLILNGYDITTPLWSRAFPSYWLPFASQFYYSALSCIALSWGHRQRYLEPPHPSWRTLLIQLSQAQKNSLYLLFKSSSLSRQVRSPPGIKSQYTLLNLWFIPRLVFQKRKEQNGNSWATANLIWGNHVQGNWGNSLRGGQGTTVNVEFGTQQVKSFSFSLHLESIEPRKDWKPVKTNKIFIGIVSK